MVEKETKRTLREKMHNLADRVTDGLEATGDFINRTTEQAGRKLDEAVDAAKAKHENIIAKGGYRQALTRLGEDIGQRTQRFYDGVEKSFFTDGEFDPTKAKQTLKDQGAAVERYGRRAYNELSRLATNGAESARVKFREYIPTQEEMNGRYAGIGTDRKLMFKPELEACLKYHDEAAVKMAPRASYRGQILTDIKSSGSTCLGELMEFYSARIESAGNTGSFDVHTIDKIRAAARLLK